MRQWVIASGNPGKLKEIEKILQSERIKLTAQSELKVPEAAETGTTFIENALIKAKNACLHTNLPALADDSGLVVDALSGEPGIFSSRYAGAQASDQDNLEKLLLSMRAIPETQRSARFVCVMVVMQHAKDPFPIIAQGSWEGDILFKAQGEGGFGYDPVFKPRSFACSAAELDAATKNQRSHRGQALSKLLDQIKSSC